jgi:ribosomal protein L7/L12
MAEPKFSAVTNNININTQEAQKKRQEASNILNSDSDVLDLVGIGAATAGVASALSTVEASTAKEDYLNLVTSEGYMLAKDTGKAEMMESFLQGSSDRSNTYQNAIKGYSATEYSRAFKGREEETRVSKLNLAGAEATAWLQQPSKVEDPNQDYSDPDAPIEYLTNEEAGKKLSDYVAAKNKQDPTLGKVELGQAVLNESYMQMYADVASAKNKEQLDDILKSINEFKQTLDTPFLLGSKEKQAVSANRARESKLSALISQKEGEFKVDAQNRIGLAANTQAEYAGDKYAVPIPLEEFETAYPGKGESKYQDYNNNYIKYEKARRITAAADISVSTNWTGTNEPTKEMLQQKLDSYIVDSILSGNFAGAADTIVAHGAVDSSRLDATRELTVSALGNKETADGMYTQLMSLNATNPAALNFIFKDMAERSKVLALKPIADVTGKSLAEAWIYVNSTPSIRPAKLSRTEISEKNKLLVNDTSIPTVLKKEMNVMYDTLTAYGVPHSVAIEQVKKYKKSNPYATKFSTDPSTAQQQEWHITNISSKDTDTVYLDPVTNTYRGQTIFGDSSAIIDKKGLDEYVVKRDNVAKFNSAHMTQVVAEQTLSELVSGTSRAVEGTIENTKDIIDFYTFGKGTDLIEGYFNAFNKDGVIGGAEGKEIIEQQADIKYEGFDEDASLWDKFIHGKYVPGVGYIDARKTKGGK